MAKDGFLRTYIMLRPMTPGLSGFARLETSSGRARVSARLRGLKGRARGVRLFVYGGDGNAQELGRAMVAPDGQAYITSEVPPGRMNAAPARVMAVMAVSDEDSPRPLMFGLMTQLSAGSALDCKNAMLELCKRLGRGEPEREPEPVPEAVTEPETVTQPEIVTEPEIVTQPEIVTEPGPEAAPESEIPEEEPAREPDTTSAPEDDHALAMLPAIDPDIYRAADELTPEQYDIRADDAATLIAMELPAAPPPPPRRRPLDALF